jgi:anaerobic magnesium-protoporphyrin IX monomethyl ester cyclase
MRATICYVGGEMMESKFMCLAPYQLVGCLRERGVEAGVFCITPDDFEDPALVDRLVDQDVVGFSCNTFTYAFLLPLAKELKRRAPHVHTVLGGAHALFSHREILRVPAIDYVVSGPGDHVLPDLVERLGAGESVADLPGLSYRRSGLPAHNPPGREKVSPDLPRAAYDLLEKTPRILIFETSRGCPYRCTFCSIDQNSTWTGWAPEVVLDRFESCVASLKDPGSLRNIMFGDDNFATDQKRAAGVLTLLHQRFPKLILSFETRAREVLRDPILLRTCAEQGIRTSFLFGIECGYDEGLQRVKKALTVEQVRRTAAMLKELGRQDGAVFSYIVGFPWETREQRMTTLRLADELYELHGVKSTCFYWLPTPSPLAEEFGIQMDVEKPFWWRDVQVEMNRIVDDEEAALMAKVNSNGNFSDTRIDDTSRPGSSPEKGRSPREIPARQAS